MHISDLNQISDARQLVLNLAQSQLVLKYAGSTAKLPAADRHPRGVMIKEGADLPDLHRPTATCSATRRLIRSPKPDDLYP
jgi:hypothetical protein